MRGDGRLLLGATAAGLALALAGCGAGPGKTMQPASAALTLAGGEASIDTNCTGCNAVRDRGSAYRFTAMQADGAPAEVAWTLSGGDAKAGAGSIDAAGAYTPPSFLTADRVDVMLTARLTANPAIAASTHLTITPGFLEPITPENVALGAGGTVTLTGRLSQAGGNAAIHFAVAGSARGGEGGAGMLGPVECTHSQDAFTFCTVTYTAPATVDAPEVTYVEARSGVARTEVAILLNPAGVTSNPVQHREAENGPIALGGSGGNNGDLDAREQTVADCCGGTLGALIADGSGRQYLLSNNHVLARSDHAAAGDAIVNPGLIDNNCTPYGDGPGTTPVATLTGWLPLKSAQTNADAAIAQVSGRMVDSSGGILELGSRQADGTLASAPPGISSSGGKGETGRLGMRVAKSGRTTGLTCGAVSAVDVDVAVQYFGDCAETRPYLTKVFTHQLALSGDRFSDAGDSGSLVVDAANAEPVGLFFAGGVDAAGVVESVATPAPEVLSELGALGGSGTSYNFVGGTDHAVSCLSYGDSTVAAAQREPLSTVEMSRAQQALFAARLLVNPSQGVLGVALGKSSDRPGEAAIVVYVDEAANPNVPAQVAGVRTVVIASTAQAVAQGSAPVANAMAMAPALVSASLNRALQVKQQTARRWMQGNPAIFGVGAGQSLDNPREAALVVYVDQNRMPAELPQSMDGVRTRYVVMDRLHVTRSYAAAGPAQHCLARPAAEPDPAEWVRDQKSKLF